MNSGTFNDSLIFYFVKAIYVTIYEFELESYIITPINSKINSQLAWNIWKGALAIGKFITFIVI